MIYAYFYCIKAYKGGVVVDSVEGIHQLNSPVFSTRALTDIKHEISDRYLSNVDHDLRVLECFTPVHQVSTDGKVTFGNGGRV